jgi:hypothetical protein
MKIALSEILVDPTLQARAGGVDEAEAQAYCEAMKRGDAFPPVIVFGSQSTPGEASASPGNCYLLADGFHRVRGAELARLSEIEADVRPGGRREALLYSLGANAAHGLRRTPEDKRRAVTTLLTDPEWCMCSDRWVADVANVSHTMVANMRKSMLADATGKVASCLPIEGKRVGRDERLRRMPPKPTKLEEAGVRSSGNVASRPSGNAARRDVYAEFGKQFSDFLKNVPPEQLHLICGRLRNLADDSDPEFQEQQRLVELERQEKQYGKRRKGRA